MTPTTETSERRVELEKPGDERPMRSVFVTRTYPTDAEDLWDAVTSAERIARWFLPVSGELRLGGRYALEGNAEGTIESCDPPRSYSATWEYGGGISWIVVSVEPAGDDAATFRLEHRAPVDATEEHWDQYGPGAVGIGWDLGLHGLRLHIEGGPHSAPAEGDGQAWVASPEGVAFINEVGRAWGEAHAAAGGDPAEARAAAERTIGFYTGTS